MPNAIRSMIFILVNRNDAQCSVAMCCVFFFRGHDPIHTDHLLGTGLGRVVYVSLGRVAIRKFPTFCLIFETIIFMKVIGSLFTRDFFNTMFKVLTVTLSLDTPYFHTIPFHNTQPHFSFAHCRMFVRLATFAWKTLTPTFYSPHPAPMFTFVPEQQQQQGVDCGVTFIYKFAHFIRVIEFWFCFATLFDCLPVEAFTCEHVWEGRTLRIFQLRFKFWDF